MGEALRDLERLWAAAYDPATRRHLSYPSGTLLTEFELFTSKYASRPALDFFGARTSYAELRRAVQRVAGQLYRLGVRPGDHVALLMPTCPQHVVAYYAVLACGASVVEHNPLYTSRELAPLFADHRARLAIVWDAAAPSLQALPEQVRPATIIAIDLIAGMPLLKRLLLKLPFARARRARAQLSRPAPGTIPFGDLLAPCAPPPRHTRPAASDVALLLYTSGTTGAPKGVPLTHANLLASTTQALEWVHTMVPGREVFLACLPLFHVFGCSLSMNAGLSIGAMLHLIPKPETGLILDAIKRRTPTMVIAVPPLFDRIVTGAAQRHVSLRGIRTGISGAMALRGDLTDRWEQATGGLLIEGYGLSECSPIVAGNPVNPTRRAGSIGVPFPDTQVRLADPQNPAADVGPGEPGEILVRGPQVFAGYRELPDETAEAFHEGWFRTGDVAVADEQGFLTIVDRIKEVVITGGFNVYPSEVEQAMRDRDGIADIAVVGLADERDGEQVVAAVVTRDGLLPDLEELRRSVKQRLAAYKVPRRIYLLSELPRNEMGKILRREVRSRLDRIDLGERLAGLRPQLKLPEILPELGERLAELGPQLRERLETAGPEVRERLGALDAEVRARLASHGPRLRERIEALDLGARLELWRTHLFDITPHPAAAESRSPARQRRHRSSGRVAGRHPAGGGIQ